MISDERLDEIAAAPFGVTVREVEWLAKKYIGDPPMPAPMEHSETG